MLKKEAGITGLFLFFMPVLPNTKLVQFSIQPSYCLIVFCLPICASRTSLFFYKVKKLSRGTGGRYRPLRHRLLSWGGKGRFPCYPYPFHADAILCPRYEADNSGVPRLDHAVPREEEVSTPFIRVESGEGKAVLNGVERELEDGSAVVIPAGVEHNIVNSSKSAPLKLYSIYSPPEHPHGTIHKNKAEALDYEKGRH